MNAQLRELIEAAGARPVMDGRGFHIEGTTGKKYTEVGSHRYEQHAETECKKILRAALDAVLANPPVDQRQEVDKDVHIRHCCNRHGCKYGEDNCPVATGREAQAHPCEYCREDAASPPEAAAVVTHRNAREALDNMDDYARMSTGVDPKGPRGMLEQYIAQQEALAPAGVPPEAAAVGTIAPAIGGGHWYRTAHGWKWNGPDGSGSTFPRPGGDWTGELIAPAGVPAVDGERVAQLIAHRACCGSEHDPANGKLHGYCVVCGVDWPCEYAGTPPPGRERPNG